MRIKVKLAPHALRSASGFVACWARARIWVGKVETGSLIERGQDTPENAVATNMIGAVSPMARASPIRRPVTTPCKL